MEDCLTHDNRSIAYSDFPDLYLKGRTGDDSRGFPTDEIEELAQRLITEAESDALSGEQVREFLRQICYWSGKAGVVYIWPRLRDADEARLLEAFLGACSYVKDLGGDSTDETIADAISGAINCFDDIPGVATSYASKFTRFLVPNYSAVLDSFIATELGVRENTENYVKYSFCCQAVARRLNEVGIVRPGANDGVWRAADVDLALWAYVDEMRSRKRPSKQSQSGQVPPQPLVNMNGAVTTGGPSNPSDDNSFCTNRVCIDCYEAVARDLQREIRLYNKTNLAYGDDAMALLRAFRLGEEVGRIKDVGMTTVNDLSRQNCICQCSYGPFPSEVSQESDACSNTAGLDKSFWRAKNDRVVSNPNAWKAGMQVALRIAAAHCDGCGVPHTTSVDWPSTELFKAEAKRLKFARPADL